MTTPQDNIPDRHRTVGVTDRSVSRSSTDRTIVNKTDTKNLKTVTTTTTKTIKQITEKKLRGGKWVNVTRNVEVDVTQDSGKSTPQQSAPKRDVDDRTSRTRQVGNDTNTTHRTVSSDYVTTSSTNEVNNTTQGPRGTPGPRGAPHGSSILVDQQHSRSNQQHIIDNTQRIHSSAQSVVSSSSSQNITNQHHTTQRIVGSSNISRDHVGQNTQHSTTDSHITRGGDSTQRITSSDYSGRQSNQGHVSESHIQRNVTSSTQVHKGTHSEQHISRSSQHSTNRNQLSDSVTKTSIEFQRAMHGGGNDPPANVIDSSSRSGHHKRTSDLVSDSNSSNAILHRKGVHSNTEAHHSISSTAAAQRKSIGNLCERGEYISNSTHSTDRKSISSMHRSTRDNMAVISQHESSDARRNQTRRDGQSTLATDRQNTRVVRDNLRVGGDFYGQSEARSYGSFSRSEHAQKTDRTERVERVERVTRHGNASHFVLGDGSTSYKREFTSHVHGTCPATLIESGRTPFKHTRDSREHKFYATKITQQQ